MRKEEGHCVRGLTFEALKEIWKSVVVTAAVFSTRLDLHEGGI